MKRLGFLIIFSLASLISSAQEAPKANAITHGPYLCDMKQDGVTVAWTTALPSLSWVEVAPVNDGNFYKQERPSYFQTVAGKRLVDRTQHAIRIEGLDPNTKYQYRIFSKDAEYLSKIGWLKYGKPVATSVSGKYSFTTFAKERKDVSFVVVNDIHGQPDFMKEVLANVDFSTLDFVMFNGDMSSWVTSEEELFKDYMDTSVALFATHTPIMYARGNHETRGRFSHKLSDYFPTTDGRFYQVYYDGDVCFLVLDGGEDKPDSDYEYSGTAQYDAYREQEAQWLKKVVASDEFKNARARIVFLHIPPPVGDWHANDHLQKTFMPILNEADIDVMLSGHTHRYSFNEANGKASFPILVNGNKTYAKCTVTDDEIKIDIIGLEASEAHSHVIKIKE